ncbi:MAG: hypothetical protein CL748_01110 [Chloroflexi bacterium]|nr:hypothetical protein [Chloroflexota bacterium]
MNIITIEGKLGSGAPEIAKDIAKRLSFDYIDRIIMAEIAKKVNTSLNHVIETEENVHLGLNKFVKAIQKIIKNSASTGMVGDPYFGPDIEQILSTPYQKMNQNNENFDEEMFIQTTSEVIEDIYSVGNAVIIGRGASEILKNHKDVFKIGIACDKKDRINRIISEQNINNFSDAKKIIEQADKNQNNYYNHAFSSKPLNVNLLDIIINSSHFSKENISNLCISIVKNKNNL